MGRVEAKTGISALVPLMYERIGSSRNAQKIPSQAHAPSDPQWPPSGNERDACAVGFGFEPSVEVVTRTRRGCDEPQIRHQIDLAIGRALVDQSFATFLLADPALALETAGCGQAQYLAVQQIRAQDLGDFAIQIFDLFWGSGVM